MDDTKEQASELKGVEELSQSLVGVWQTLTEIVPTALQTRADRDMLAEAVFHILNLLESKQVDQARIFAARTLMDVMPRIQ